MKPHTEYLEEEFIVWNSTLGIRDFATIGEIKTKKNQTQIWLDEPYDMVGPLCLDELFLKGEIEFAACIVMTKNRWNTTKQKLQKESLKKQQKIHQEFKEKLKQRNKNKQGLQNSEQEYRKLLSLPLQGKLKITQIKTAYKKLAKIEHPDVGGSHEKFVLITEAKEALILVATEDY